MSYIDDHLARFDWRPDVSRIVRLLRDRWDAQTWVGTYHWHPLYAPPVITRRHRDETSFDVWGFGGRGDPIGTELGDRVFEVLFNDPDPPDIWWIIWNGRMWTRAQGFVDAPPGPPGSDPDHVNHIHVTYMD